MFKKIIFTIPVLILIVVSTLGADDGSWNKSFTIGGGSIYSESDNADIELIKEILIFNGEYTRAVFQFKNTSNKPVTISCGFPVRYEINAFISMEGLKIPFSPYGPGDDIPVLGYLETLTIEHTDPDDYMFGMTTDIILINSFNNSREFISQKGIPEDLSFNIKQNGKNVEINKVLLERYAGENGTWVTFHYRHNLNFKPGEVSTVAVEYDQDLFYGEDGMSDTYLWNYVIGTGGTWKGPIGEFILMKPATWPIRSIEGVNLLLEGRDITVFRAADYEPAREEAFSLWGNSVSWMEQYEYFENEFPALKKMVTDRSKLANQPADAVQGFVTDITASSWLPDKISVFTNDGVISKANFSPIAAFDGLAETSWCENVKGDGIGQYLEFSLTKRVWGIGINNGFTRLPLKDWLFEPDRMEKIPFEEMVKDDSKGFKDYFTQNNRIKKLSVTDSMGNVLHTLELDDQRDLQAFTGIILSPGTYRLVIEEVYRGTKWQDTCLGEVTFLESGNNQQMGLITADQFYMDALRGVSYK